MGAAGHTFREVKTAYVRLLDERMEEVVQYPLAETPNSSGLVVCALHRSTMGWRLVAMGKAANGNMARVWLLLFSPPGVLSWVVWSATFLTLECGGGGYGGALAHRTLPLKCRR